MTQTLFQQMATQTLFQQMADVVRAQARAYQRGAAIQQAQPARPIVHLLFLDDVLLGTFETKAGANAEMQMLVNDPRIRGVLRVEAHVVHP